MLLDFSYKNHGFDMKGSCFDRALEGLSMSGMIEPKKYQIRIKQKMSFGKKTKIVNIPLAMCVLLVIQLITPENLKVCHKCYIIPK